MLRAVDLPRDLLELDLNTLLNYLSTNSKFN
jgi:hypothetical protein